MLLTHNKKSDVLILHSFVLICPWGWRFFYEIRRSVYKYVSFVILYNFCACLVRINDHQNLCLSPLLISPIMCTYITFLGPIKNRQMQRKCQKCKYWVVKVCNNFFICLLTKWITSCYTEVRFSDFSSFYMKKNNTLVWTVIFSP